jgi:hypothetical protein
MVQVMVLAKLPRGSSGCRHAQKIRQRRRRLAPLADGVDNGSHKNERIQDPVETPDGETAFRAANDKKEQQTAGGLEALFHGTKTVCVWIFDG